MVELVEQRAHRQQIAGDHAGLVFRQSTLDHVGELGQLADEVGLFSAGLVTFGGTLGSAALTQDGRGTGVGILHVGACVALEGQSVLPIEIAVLDTAVGQGVEYHRAHTHRLGDVLLVLQIGVLFLDDCAALADGFRQQVVQKHHVAGTGGQLFAANAHGAVGHVNQTLCPFVAHSSHHGEPLGEVQALTRAGDVDAFMEIVFLLSPDGGGDITGGIQGGAVAL